MSTPHLIGLIPAGGHGTRIAPLPCSKELLPIGFQHAATGATRPKVVCQYLLERMRLADVRHAYIVLRKGKWDIPDYFGDGAELDMALGYLIMRLPFGVPYTLDQAYPFVRDATIVFGFPDILFAPDDSFVRLLAHQRSTHADIVLGLFPTDQPHIADMVELDPVGRVRSIVIKQARSDLRYAWINAVWGPRFTQLIHDYVAANAAPTGSEVYLGHIIQAAIEQGLLVAALPFADGRFLDIGTPSNLIRAVAAGGLPDDQQR